LSTGFGKKNREKTPKNRRTGGVVWGMLLWYNETGRFRMKMGPDDDHGCPFLSDSDTEKRICSMIHSRGSGSA
jgi:hypothetical protein